jgi:hypothetical protein
MEIKLVGNNSFKENVNIKEAYLGIYRYRLSILQSINMKLKPVGEKFR